MGFQRTATRCLQPASIFCRYGRSQQNGNGFSATKQCLQRNGACPNVMARQVRCGHEGGASRVASVIIVCLSPRPCRRCLKPSHPTDGQVVEAIQHFAQHVSRRMPEHHVLAGPRVDGSRAGDGFWADDDPGWLQATCVSQSSIQASDDRCWTPRRASLPRPKLVRRAMMLLSSDVICPPPRVAGTPRQQHQRQNHLQRKHLFESSSSFSESSISRG